MVQEIFLQNWIFTKFLLPFLLIWVIVFAVLEKTNLLGEGKHQINAIVSLVIGLIFVGVAFPKEVVNNLILFLVVALIVMFVGLILWGFISGGNLKGDILEGKGIKIAFGIVVLIALIIAVFWATGIENNVIDFLFKQSWSESFWVNFLFIALVAIAVVFVMYGAGKATSG